MTGPKGGRIRGSPLCNFKSLCVCVCVCVFSVLPALLGGWGHTTLAVAHSRLVFIGGVAGGMPVDSASILHRRDNDLCTLARDSTQCHALYGCRACVNMTDRSTPSFLSCFSTSNQNSSTIGGRCSLIGGVVEETGPSSGSTCGLNSNCQDCLVEGGWNKCVWCDCSASSVCVSSLSRCPCDRSLSPAQIGVCPSYDRCSGYPSCTDCLGNGCSWSNFDATASRNRNALSFDNTSTIWACHAPSSSDHTPFETCPAPCTNWSSCLECVGAYSPLGGPTNCIWSTASKECFSASQYPLLCASGNCGSLAGSNESCPISCSDRSSCDLCLSVPECVWTQAKGQHGACINIADSALLVFADSALLNDVHYLECPDCGECSEEHGRCDLATLGCECDLGYVGEGCGVACECNGHSDCAGVSEEGRRTCTNCLHDTQVRAFQWNLQI